MLCILVCSQDLVKMQILGAPGGTVNSVSDSWVSTRFDLRVSRWSPALGSVLSRESTGILFLPLLLYPCLHKSLKNADSDSWFSVGFEILHF